jgi:hypothetical protein
VVTDPNDIIVRAVPNARGVAEFIDEEWTTFVAEFNVRARAISHALVAETAKPLVKFLQVTGVRDVWVLSLRCPLSWQASRMGGLKVELHQVWVNSRESSGVESGFDTDDDFETRGRNTPSGFLSPSSRRRHRKTSQLNTSGLRTVNEWGFKLGIVISVDTKPAHHRSVPVSQQESPIVEDMPLPVAATSPQYRSHNTSYNISDYSSAYAAALMKEDKSALERFGIHTASAGDGMLLPGGDDASYGTVFKRYSANNDAGKRLFCPDRVLAVRTVHCSCAFRRVSSHGNRWIAQRT